MIGPISDVSDFVVRIRGIPWSCSKDEIVDFFNDCNVKNGTEGVHFVHAHESGKPSGEAFIELETSEDVDKAKKHTMGYIGTRYIEVYDSTKEEMVFILNGGKRSEAKSHRKEGRPPPNFRNPHQFQNENFGFMANTCVRLRGLPFSCTEKDLYEFFDGIEIVPHGIKMPLDGKYRSVGEAYVKFATTADVDKAMSKHKEKIGHRYIELFRSNPREFDNCYVPGWTPPPRPPPPADRPPWMNDYGPRGPVNSYPAYDYGPRWNDGGGPPFQPPHPSHQFDYNYNSYNNYFGPPGPPPYEANPWPPYHYAAHPPGPMRGSVRPPHRLVPYERPPPWASEPMRLPEPQLKSPSPPPPQPPPPPPPPVSRPLGNNFVFVRNLPHNVVEKDIDLFFRVKPTNVKIILDPYGRPEEANVAFATHEDAVKAMEQDKQLLFDKQVDLFLCSKEIPNAVNGSRQQKEPAKKEDESPNSNYNFAYSYKASPSNGSNGKENGNANPPVPSPSSQPAHQPPPPPPPPLPSSEPAKAGENGAADAKAAQDNLSYFGMPPVKWPSSTAPGAAATSAAYPPWSVPYYSQNGQYYGYAAYTYPVNPANPPATSSIRREPVNYTSR